MHVLLIRLEYPLFWSFSLRALI